MSLLLALGCGPRHSRYSSLDHVDTPVGEPLPAATSDSNALMKVALVARGASRSRVNDLSRPMHTGDQLALLVESSEPRYLYFVNLAPDGSRKVISAHRGERSHNHSVRIPDSGWLQLAGQSGAELLAVVATRQPLGKGRTAESKLFELVERTAARNDLAKLQSPHPPGFSSAGHASMGIRAHALALHQGTVHVDANDDSTVVLIDIDHRPD